MVTTAYVGGEVWGYWCHSDSSGTATAVASDMTWDSWNRDTGNACSGGTMSSTDTWTYWNATGRATVQVQGSVVTNLDGIWASQGIGTTFSKECLKDMQARRKKAAEQEEARRLERIEEEKRQTAAEEVALELLETFIGRKEREVYEQTGRLMIKGKEADYIIHKDRGVSRVEKNKVVDLCIHLKERYKYPDTDNVIAVALNLLDDEKNFNELANRHGSQDRPTVLPRCANGFN